MSSLSRRSQFKSRLRQNYFHAHSFSTWYKKPKAPKNRARYEKRWLESSPFPSICEDIVRPAM